MAASTLPDGFYDTIAHHLPPEQPVGPYGGRPPIPHEVAVRVIWFVLSSGCRWEDVPLELGCSGRTAHRRLQAWEEAGVWDHVHADLLRLLREAGKLDMDLVVVDSVIVRAFGGGEQTGPSPVDRGKSGTKHTLMVSDTGVPLAIRTAGANASDHTPIIPLALDFPQVGGKPVGPGRHRTSCTPTADTTARRRDGSSAGWVSSRGLRSERLRMGADWVGCDGSWSEPSVGSRDFAGCECDTIAWASSEMPGQRWQPVPFAFGS